MQTKRDYKFALVIGGVVLLALLPFIISFVKTYHFASDERQKSEDRQAAADWMHQARQDAANHLQIDSQR